MNEKQTNKQNKKISEERYSTFFSVTSSPPAESQTGLSHAVLMLWKCFKEAFDRFLHFNDTMKEFLCSFLIVLFCVCK